MSIEAKEKPEALDNESDFIELTPLDVARLGRYLLILGEWDTRSQTAASPAASEAQSDHDNNQTASAFGPLCESLVERSGA